MSSISTPKQLLDTRRYKIQDTLFGIFWRLTILMLPLQTRWFSDASLVGWPFEQGRLSFYVSWIPLIFTIILGFYVPKINLSKKLRTNLFWLIALLGAINIVSTPVDIRATSMWWIQIFLLLPFFVTLLRSHVKITSILPWFIIALIPHAIFAIAQSVIQYVPGWSWIGVATQDPKSLGVSVIEVFDLRYLRSYGGFPHPNILGGYMAFAALILTWLFSSSEYIKNKWHELAILVLIPFFTVALFYSYSRSAWIALAIGLALLSLPLILRGRRRGLITALTIIATFATFAFINWDTASVRLGLSKEPARLEQLSTNARSSSLKNGIKVFQAYPIFGTGPNSELPVLANIATPFNKGGMGDLVGQGGISRSPLEPPHNVIILILANFGVAGSLIIFGFFIFLLRQVLIHWKVGDKNLRNLALALIAAWLIISLFDHYLYSLWSGQILSVFTAFILIFWLTSKANQPLDV